MSEFEIIFVGADSIFSVFTRPGDDATTDDVLVDLKNFSGKVRIRRVVGSVQRSNYNPPTAPLVKDESGPSITRPTRPALRPSFSATELATEPPEPKDDIGELHSKIDHVLHSSNSTVDTDDLNSKARSNSFDESFTAEFAFTTWAGLRQTGPQEQRRRSSKRVSIKDVTQPGTGTENEKIDDIDGEVPGRTILHHLCAQQTIDSRHFADLLEQHPALVKRHDANGQLPLHVLGNNIELLNFGEGQKVATRCALLLMNTYPDSIIKVDVEGRMPFTHFIVKWVKWTHRFRPVLIVDEVEWCFQMLSYGMDHLGGKPLIPGKQVRPTLAYKKQREQREALATNVATIPGILKTILLIESKAIRSNILESSILRRTLLCSEAVGPWLTSMIRYQKDFSSKVALDFLSTLSRLNGEDFIGGYRKMLPDDEAAFFAAKLELYKAVERIGDLIPTLLIAGEQATSNAVTTPLVFFIMNRQMARPFTMGAGVGACVLHVTAIYAFRMRLLHYVNEAAVFVDFPWMNLNSVIICVTINEVIFKLGEYVALSRVSASSARKVAFGGGAMLDFVGIILALIAAVISQEMQNDQIERPVMMALVVGLLWFRVMSFLKVVNEHLATFILALRQMVYDVRFFSLVLLVFIVMFGDMFQLIVRNDNDVDCSDPDLEGSLKQFCSNRSIDSYLQTYAIVVGDLNYDEYNDLGAITFLWISTTFIGTILLLNALIAVVTMSYADSRESSVILFRRARAQFLASHSVVERFLRPSQSRWTETMSPLNPIYWGLMFMRWLLLLTFLTTTVWSTLFVYELTAFSIRYQFYSFTAPLVILGLMLVLLTLSIGSFVITILVEQICPPGKVQDFLLRLFDVQANLVTKKIVSRAYGVDRNDTEGGEVVMSRNAEILTGFTRLENLLRQVIAKQERMEEEEVLTAFGDISVVQESMKSLS